MIIRTTQCNKEFLNTDGFNPGYASFMDYIDGITEKIWEKREIWLLYDTYAEDVIVHSGARTVQGRDTVIEGTLKTLYSFPDRKMETEAIIWAPYVHVNSTPKNTSRNETIKKNGVKPNSYFSSHRIFSTATNLGKTGYGAPTGKRIQFRTIADCLARENFIYEEWLVRDNLDIVYQLGFDPFVQAKQDKRYNNIDIARYDDGTLDIDLHSLPAESEAIEIIGSMFKDLWLQQNYDKVSQYYSNEAISYGICQKIGTTHDRRTALLVELTESLTDISVHANQITCTENPHSAEVAIRWRIKGTHRSNGILGLPTSNAVNILGINHYEIVLGKITREWMVYDAFDAICQTYNS